MAGSAGSRLRICVFSERLAPPFDEGIKNLATAVICELSRRHTVLSLTAFGEDVPEYGIRNVRAGKSLIAQDLNLVQQTMWNYAGIVRSPRRLTRARRILLELREEIQSFYHDCHVSRELVELRNAVQTALLVVHAASLNPVSKGAHYVIDE